MDKIKCMNMKLHPYWKTGIYGWLGEEVDDNDYMICPICGEILAMNYWDYSAEHDGDNKCPECGQELDYSEIYDFEDTLYFKQLLEMKDDKIAYLEEKLEESEKLNKGYLSLIDNYIYQLNEKDELLRQKINKMKSTDFIRMCVSCGFMVQAKEIDNQTAIDELEKVRSEIEFKDNVGYVKSRYEVVNYINQQIAELKGEK